MAQPSYSWKFSSLDEANLARRALRNELTKVGAEAQAAQLNLRAADSAEGRSEWRGRVQELGNEFGVLERMIREL